MLTMKAKYGLKAMAALAALDAGVTTTSSTIADQCAIPKKFLDTILLELRNAGMVRSRKGPFGGYGLAMAAETVFVGDVIRILDGPLAPIRCASRTAYQACDDCADPEECQVRAVMTVVRDAMADVLDSTSLTDFVAGNRASNLE